MNGLARHVRIAAITTTERGRVTWRRSGRCSVCTGFFPGHWRRQRSFYARSNQPLSCCVLNRLVQNFNLHAVFTACCARYRQMLFVNTVIVGKNVVTLSLSDDFKLLTYRPEPITNIERVCNDANFDTHGLPHLRSGIFGRGAKEVISPYP